MKTKTGNPTRLITLFAVLSIVVLAGCDSASRATLDDGVLAQLSDRKGKGKGPKPGGNASTGGLDVVIDPETCEATVISEKDISNLILDCGTEDAVTIEASEDAPIANPYALGVFLEGDTVCVKAGKNGSRGVGELFTSDCTLAMIYVIGDTGPGGGIVFWVNEAGTSGLEAAPVDQGSAAWCADFIDIEGVDNITNSAEEDPNSGEINTPLIIEHCPTSGSAAELAANYEWPEGQTDGFLPNKEELNLLYEERDVVGGFTSGIYWSSSEYNSYNAWDQYFFSGYQYILSQLNPLGVRAVRAF